MKKIIILIGSLSLAAAGHFLYNIKHMLKLIILVDVPSATEDDFTAFKDKYHKSYDSEYEEQYRKEIFLENHNKVLQHHQQYAEGKVHWDMAMNEEEDLTEEEFFERHGIHDLPLPVMQLPTYSVPEVASDVPSEWSWVDQGGVSSVKNQVIFKTVCERLFLYL